MKNIKLWLIQLPVSVASLAAGIRVFTLVAAADVTNNPASGTASVPSLGVTDKTGLTGIICNFVNYFTWIVLVVSVIMVLFAAFDYVTAQDDTEKTSRARWTLTYGAVGIAVVLLAAAFPSIVASVAGTSSGGGTFPSCVTRF